MGTSEAEEELSSREMVPSLQTPWWPAVMSSFSVAIAYTTTTASELPSTTVQPTKGPESLSGTCFQNLSKTSDCPNREHQGDQRGACCVTSEATNCSSSLQQDADSLLSSSPEWKPTGLPVINSTYTNTNSQQPTPLRSPFVLQQSKFNN